jgi:acylphosphatase
MIYVRTDKPGTKISRRYLVRGRVQGVGFRYFVERAAGELKIDGYVRNLDDGRVEVYAIGPEEKLKDLAGLLWKGPRWSEVRGVEEIEVPMLEVSGFHIRH